MARGIKTFLLAAAVAFVLLMPGSSQSDFTARPDLHQQAADSCESPTRNNTRRSCWFFDQRAYPLGYLPEGGRLNALRAKEGAGKAREATKATHIQTAAGQLSGVESSTALAANPWNNIGPAPITGGQIGQTGGTRDMTGRVADVAVDPTNNNHWLIGAAQGGIWETTDAGVTWSPRTDDQESLAMGAIAFAPNSSSTVYAGTGEASFSCGAYFGAGLLKSTNGGSTWQELASAPSFEGATFSDIKVNPANQDNVLAATATGVAGRVSSCVSPPPPSPGVFESSDGGLNWQLRQSGTATDIEVDPTNFSNQYAGIRADGVYRSTNGGDTWTKITTPTAEWNTLPGGIGRVELASAPSNANVLYVSIQDRPTTPPAGNDNGLLGLWKTTNAWAATPAFVRIDTGPTDNGTGTFGYCGWNPAYNEEGKQCEYDHEVIVDPSNADILYAGGVPLWKYAPASVPAWTEVSQTTPAFAANGIHVDQHTMAWAGSRLIVGNDGGVDLLP